MPVPNSKKTTVENRSHFKRIQHRRPTRKTVGQPNYEAFLALLHNCIVEPFHRISGLEALLVPLGLGCLEEMEDSPSNPGHAACAKFAGTDYCQKSWKSYLAELKHRVDIIWHKCDYHMLCALVPVVYNGRCPAVFQLVCPESIGEDCFKQHIELLDILIENLVSCEADFLAKVFPPEKASINCKGPSLRKSNKPAEKPPSHPQVLRSLEYIEAHFCDPRMTVGRIALALDIHPDYLAHLFNAQVGQRMSRYIADRRLERAKELLSTTGWQIKRIALETGHANRNWFSHVFAIRTGLTPSEYQQKAREQSQNVPNQGGKVALALPRSA